MPFKPGQSGNPSGRPKKGYSIRGCLQASMGETITIPGKDGKPDETITKADFLSRKLFAIAASGDLAAIKACLDNIDGPPTQGVALTGEGGGPIQTMAVKFIAPGEDANG